MKHVLVLTVASLISAPSAMAVVSISLTGNPNSAPQFFLSADSSSVVPDGSLIRIGTFETAPAAGATFTEFAGSFREFARTTMGNSVNTNTGRPVRNNITGGADANSPDPDDYFIGKTIYIWVYSTPNGDTDGSTAQGVFQLAAGATSNTFADAPSAKNTSTQNYLTAFGINPDPYRGTAASTAVTANAVTRFNLAAPIPEPASAATLGLLGVLGLMRRRR